jgi:hypothetical protein
MRSHSAAAVALDPDDSPIAALRRELVAAAGRSIARPLPTPMLASAERSAAVRDYLAWWATHPNPAGSFASRTRRVRWLPARWLPPVMFALGYDGLIHLDAGTVVGHVFFQRRGADLHAFSTAVHPPFEGCGYSLVFLLDFVVYAAGRSDVRAARVGRGQNRVAQRFLERLRAHESALGCRVDADGWIRFTR